MVEIPPAPVLTGFRDGRNRARVMITPGTIAPLGYLTPQDEFGDVVRGNPLPLSPPAQRLHRAVRRGTSPPYRNDGTDTMAMSITSDPLGQE